MFQISNELFPWIDFVLKVVFYELDYKRGVKRAHKKKNAGAGTVWVGKRGSTVYFAKAKDARFLKNLSNDLASFPAKILNF